MSEQLKVFIEPDLGYAAAIEAALITLPAKYALAGSAQEADLSARELLPEGTLASWTTTYFVEDAGITSADLAGKTIEISIEVGEALHQSERIFECDHVLAQLGVSDWSDWAKSVGSNSVMLAGYHDGSPVTVAHRSVAQDSTKLFISITDNDHRLVLTAPLGHTAQPVEIATHSIAGIQIKRPVYQSVISRILASI